MQQRLGHSHVPSYETVVTYHSVSVIYETLRSFFKAKDDPQVDWALENQYEEIRRELLALSIPKGSSLFGPTLFDENQRNIGRGAAGLVRRQQRQSRFLEIGIVSLASPLISVLLTSNSNGCHRQIPLHRHQKATVVIATTP